MPHNRINVRYSISSNTKSACCVSLILRSLPRFCLLKHTFFMSIMAILTKYIKGFYIKLQQPPLELGYSGPEKMCKNRYLHSSRLVVL